MISSPVWTFTPLAAGLALTMSGGGRSRGVSAWVNEIEWTIGISDGAVVLIELPCCLEESGRLGSVTFTGLTR